MKPLAFLAWLAALAPAGQISGTLQNLSGGPLQGAQLVNSREAVVSTEDGSWSLGRSAGIARAMQSQVVVSRNLFVQGGRIRVSWDGHGPMGRLSSEVVARSGGSRAARSLGAEEFDTLVVYWKGSRILVMSIPTQDTTGVALRIDTAWSDDRGFPWNPRVNYGSLRDARDGATYRTVEIGGQTWMAEGLRYVVREGDPAGGSFQRLRDAIPTLRPDDRWGVLYFYKYASRPTETGICPDGWRLPTFRDFAALNANVYRSAPGSSNVGDDFDSQYRYLGKVLRARAGWPDGGRGTDDYGFRLLPSGDHTFSFQDEEGNELLDRRDLVFQGRSGAFWMVGTGLEEPERVGQLRVGDFQDTDYPDLGQVKIQPGLYTAGAATIRCVKN